MGVLDLRVECKVGGLGYQEDPSLNTESVAHCVISSW